MATSSAISTGQQATAAQYNNLRTDALVNEGYKELFSSAHSPTSAATWEDWDISAIIPATARCAEIMIVPKDTAAHGCRKNGSALVRYIGAVTYGHPITMFCETDASRVIEIYSHGSTTSEFQVIGYIDRL